MKWVQSFPRCRFTQSLPSRRTLSTLQPLQFRQTAYRMATAQPSSSELKLDSKYKLPSGYEIPVLGLGVYQTPASETETIVTHALKFGYRHIDSARVYRNEHPCGEAIRAASVPRSEIFFTSKIPPRDMTYDRAKSAIESTLSQSGLDYVDLYLIHAPYGGKEGRLGAWRALVEAVQEGKVRSIGVSNYGVVHLDELESWQKTVSERERGTLSLGQWEIHPWLPRDDIVSWCKQRGVVIEAYSPLVRATRTDESVLKDLADAHGRTWAQILLRWSLQKGYVPLPKSVQNKRVEQNAGVFGWELGEKDMAKLDMGDSYEPCTWDPTVSRD